LSEPYDIGVVSYNLDIIIHPDRRTAVLAPILSPHSVSPPPNVGEGKRVVQTTATPMRVGRTDYPQFHKCWLTTDEYQSCAGGD
jgi:hypothetical protein